MEMRTPASFSVVVKAKLANWLPWSVLKMPSLPCRAIAYLRAATQKPASIVFNSRQTSTLRLNQSMMATR